MSRNLAGQDAALRIEGLTLFANSACVVDGASLEVQPGEVHGLVGESGSGKTLLSRSAIGLLPPAVRRVKGRIFVAGHEVTTFTQKQWRALRGCKVGMVFQEPMVSLNPGMRIGPQMYEAYRLHFGVDQKEARRRALQMLDLFRVTRPAERLSQYPHEFSGGLRQRILLSAVMMLEPDLLLADEPTTALDAVVQKEVLDTMVSATRELGTAVLMVTHDLGVVSRYCDHITVVNRGVVEESGPARDLLANPRTDYTARLLASAPANRPAASATAEQQKILSVKDLNVAFKRPRSRLFAKADTFRAVNGVSFDLRRGEILGLVGESGSGKSTIGRAILGLLHQAQGTVLFDGRNILSTPEAERRKFRSKLQLVFQDPHSALNPRMRIGASVEAALLGLPARQRRAEAERLLDATGLGAQFYSRFPHELSGGQRQRVCIARALASQPEIVVADEAVSALDVTVQAQILDLLVELQRERGFACLFISHDLDVVRSICPRTLILKDGQLVEEGPTARILESPSHPYTRQLIEAFPGLGMMQEGISQT